MYSLALLPLMVASALAGNILAVEPLPQYTQEQNTATGEYGYSYSGGPSSKTEFRALDGTTTGAYSYVDAHGLLQTVNYIADEFGFRAAGTNIPSEGSVPLDAPDVAIAKAAHLAEHSRQTLEALHSQRKKRSAPLFLAPSVATVSHLPLATSSQSRFQIHNGAKIIQEIHTPIVAPVAAPLYASHSYLLRKKRGIFAAPAPLTYAAPLPASSAKIYEEFAQRPTAFVAAAPAIHEVRAAHIVAAPAAVEVRTAAVAAAPITTVEHLPVSTSRQTRFQIHNGAKIIEEIHTPVAAPIVAAPAAVEVRAAAVAPAPIATVEHLPLSTSSQSRTQIHNGAKIIQEFHQPIYAAAAAPVAAPVHFAPAPAFLPGTFQGFETGFALAPIAPAPIAPAAPAAPATEAVVSEDAISVESA